MSNPHRGGTLLPNCHVRLQLTQCYNLVDLDLEHVSLRLTQCYNLVVQIWNTPLI